MSLLWLNNQEEDASRTEKRKVVDLALSSVGISDNEMNYLKKTSDDAEYKASIASEYVDSENEKIIMTAVNSSSAYIKALEEKIQYIKILTYQFGVSGLITNLDLVAELRGLQQEELV